MTKEMHPADTADRALIAAATHFNVHLRHGVGKVTRQEAPDLIGAIREADRMGKTNGGKAPMIYAITPDSQSVFVPDDVIAAARTANGEVKELTGAQLAKLTAILTGGDPKRSATREVAMARFLKAAGVAGVENVETIVGSTFGLAEILTIQHVNGKKEPEAVVEDFAPELATLTAANDRVEAAIERAEKIVSASKSRTRLDLSAKIATVKDNPKKTGSKSHARYSLYSAGMTVQAFIDKCVAEGHKASEATADIGWDRRKGFISVEASA